MLIFKEVKIATKTPCFGTGLANKKGMTNATVANLAAILNGGAILTQGKVGQNQSGQPNNAVSLLSSDTTTTENQNPLINQTQSEQTGHNIKFAEELKKIVIADCSQELGPDLKNIALPALDNTATNQILTGTDKNSSVTEQIAKLTQKPEQAVSNLPQISTETQQENINLNKKSTVLKSIIAEQLSTNQNSPTTETANQLPKIDSAENPNPKTAKSDILQSIEPQKTAIMSEIAEKLQNISDKNLNLENTDKTAEKTAEVIKSTTKQGQNPDLSQYMNQKSANPQNQANLAVETEINTAKTDTAIKTELKTENIAEILSGPNKTNNAQIPLPQDNAVNTAEAKIAEPQKTDLQTVMQENAKTVSRQVSESISSAVSNDTSKVLVKLNPPELGRVVLNITERNSQIDVVLEASRPETKNQLQQAFGEITKTLSDSGITLRQFEVKTIDTPKHSFQESYGQSNQPQNNQSQQHSAQQNDTSASRYYVSDLVGEQNSFAKANSSENYIGQTSVNLLI